MAGSDWLLKWKLVAQLSRRAGAARRGPSVVLSPGSRASTELRVTVPVSHVRERERERERERDSDRPEWDREPAGSRESDPGQSYRLCPGRIKSGVTKQRNAQKSFPGPSLNLDLLNIICSRPPIRKFFLQIILSSSKIKSNNDAYKIICSITLSVVVSRKSHSLLRAAKIQDDHNKVIF